MIPSEFSNIAFLEPWYAIAPGVDAQRLKLQLKKSVGQEHPLYGQHAIPLARRSENDDILFYLPGAADKPLVVVHLPWSARSAPPDPSQLQQPVETTGSSEWPYTVFYRSINHWVYKCMYPDHRELVGPNPDYIKTVEGLSEMYDGSEPGWVLVDLGPDEFDYKPRYFPENILTNAGVLICDDDAAEEIERRMLEAGVPILTPEEVRRRRAQAPDSTE